MTATQMKYLLALTEKENQSISGIADKFNVNRSSVSRSLATLIDQGLLTDNYELTSVGKHYLAEYKYKHDVITGWLMKNGIDEEDARQDTYKILEVCSDKTIRMLGQGGEFCKACNYFRKKGHKLIIEGNELQQYINRGEYQVPFIFHKDKKRSPDQISMANDAFYHPATLVITKNSGYLALRTKQMEQKSLIDKLSLAGKVDKIKYEYQNQIREAEISETMVKLPIEAMKFLYIKEDDILQGYVNLTMTCSVGIIHMPESTAILTIYL
jgi:Mn-dependent DtxR family transcriptional regulator